MPLGWLNGRCMHCKILTKQVGVDGPDSEVKHQCCGSCEGAMNTCTDAAIRAKYPAPAVVHTVSTVSVTPSLLDRLHSVISGRD